MNDNAGLELPADIVELINNRNSKEHSESYLIPVLQEVQNHFGYLPQRCLDEVSRRMQIPAARVTGVATFYHFFTLKPRGEYRITVCMGTACFVRGADAVLDHLKKLLGVDVGETTEDGKFSIEEARCLGACALAPVVLVNDRFYGGVDKDKMQNILREYGWQLPEGGML